MARQLEEMAHSKMVEDCEEHCPFPTSGLQAFHMNRALVLLVSAGLTGAAKQQPRVSIAVLPVKLLSGAEGAVDARLLDEAVLAAMQNAGRFRVIGRSDMDAVLGFEQQKDLLGCDDTKCLAEIGSAFGVDDLVDVAVARSKSGTWAVTAKMIYVAEGAPEVRGRLLRTMDGDSGLLMAFFPTVMRELAARSGLQVKPVSEIAFKPLTVSAAPPVSTRVGSPTPSGLAKINIEAERLLEKALDTEENESATAEQRARTWCALAKVEPSPYTVKAKKACAEWTSYAAAHVQLARDHETVRGYLALKRKTVDQKIAVLDAFLDAYGKLDVPEVRHALGARRQLEKEHLAMKRCPGGEIGTVGCDRVELARLGMAVERVGKRVVVVSCTARMPCAHAGLRRGDQFVNLNGHAVGSTRELAKLLDGARHQVIQVAIDRDRNRRSAWLEVP
jgi:hypothetical protein